MNRSAPPSFPSLSGPRILLRAAAALGIFTAVLAGSLEITLRIGGWYADWMLVPNPPGPDGVGTFDPDIGRLRVPGQSGVCVRTEFTYPIRVNSLGFRDDELPAQKDMDELRLWVLGDSIAAGWGVAEEQRFSELLEERLNNRPHPAGGTGRPIRVVNSGGARMGTAAEAALFEKFVDRVDPDALLLDFTTTNDFSDNMEFQRWKRRGGGRAHPPHEEAGSLKPWLRYHCHLYHLLGTLVRLPGTLRPVPPEEVEATVAALQRIDDASSERGIPLTVAIMGTLTTLRHLESPSGYQADAYRLAKEILSDGGYRTVDTIASLREEADIEKLFYPRDTHPNAAGHARLAELLAGERYFEPGRPASN